MTYREYSITWGVASAFNMGRVANTDYRLERSRNDDRSWSYMISNDSRTYLHVDNRKFTSMGEMEIAIWKWIHERNNK
jgi:hypothetical protein